MLDGVRVVFQNTPGTEAPAEMNFMFPDLGALCIAENCTHTMHNTLPFRGAQARDTLSWSKYIQEALDLFGGDMDVLFSTHNWPRFGRVTRCAISNCNATCTAGCTTRQCVERTMA